MSNITLVMRSISKSYNNRSILCPRNRGFITGNYRENNLDIENRTYPKKINLNCWTISCCSKYCNNSLKDLFREALIDEVSKIVCLSTELDFLAKI